MRLRNITILTLLLLFSLNILVEGQKIREEKPPISERLFFGGSFGFQFGTVTNIDVSPMVGLWVLPRVAIGGGPNYIYYKYHDLKTSIYGGRVFSQYLLVQDLDNVLPINMHMGIFLHLEDELLSLESESWKYPPYSSKRFTVNTVMLGGGIRQQLGQRSFFNLTALWAINESEYSIYGNPIVRVSFSF